METKKTKTLRHLPINIIKYDVRFHREMIFVSESHFQQKRRENQHQKDLPKIKVAWERPCPHAR